MNSTLGQTRRGASTEVSALRTSDVFRSILSSNPGVNTFTVERILASIGIDRVEASLMIFSLPAIVPVPTETGMIAGPTGALAYQLVSGQKRVKLPSFILNQSVSRRALATAIHAILPILEAAEKVVRPRWTWVNHSTSRRAIGLFVFLLALAIACPLFGFNPLHATSIFVVALGMAEQDGLAVLIGVAVGVVSLAILTASGLSASSLRTKAAKWLRKVAQKVGLEAFAHYLIRRGYKALARLVTFQWSELLLLWDPEGRAAARAKRRTAPSSVAAKKPATLSLAAGAVPSASLSWSNGALEFVAVGI